MSGKALKSLFDIFETSTAKEICPMERLILVCLARRANDDQICFPSIACIAKDTGINRKCVIKHRKSLIEKGFIKYMEEREGRSGQIYVMKLLYVEESPRISERVKMKQAVDKLGVEILNSTQLGTGTSTQLGTGTSTQLGTRNIKEEYKKEKRAIDEFSSPVDNFKSDDISIPVSASRGSLCLRSIPEDFMPNDKALKELSRISMKVKMPSFELLNKFIGVCKTYKTKSKNWNDTFIEFLSREMPRRTFEDVTGRQRRYDGQPIHN